MYDLPFYEAAMVRLRAPTVTSGDRAHDAAPTLAATPLILVSFAMGSHHVRLV